MKDSAAVLPILGLPLSFSFSSKYQSPTISRRSLTHFQIIIIIIIIIIPALQYTIYPDSNNNKTYIIERNHYKIIIGQNGYRVCNNQFTTPVPDLEDSGIFLLILFGVIRNRQGQLLKGVECHIYLYCFTFVYIDLNKAFVIIVLFPKNYTIKKVCANGIGK